MPSTKQPKTVPKAGAYRGASTGNSGCRFVSLVQDTLTNAKIHLPFARKVWGPTERRKEIGAQVSPHGAKKYR